MIAISRPYDSHRNARLECRIGWPSIYFSRDGAFDADISVVLKSNELISTDYKEVSQNDQVIGTEKEIMGEYESIAF